jgi:P-type E1-E2 ATPase
MNRLLLIGTLASASAAVVAAIVWSLTGAATGDVVAIGLATFFASSALPLLAAQVMPGLAGVRRARGEGIHLAADALPIVARLDTVVLDKDGTVTTGALRVISVDPLDPRDDQNLRWFAGALTHAADDRIGRAVARLATRGKLTNVEVIAGQGVRGSVDRHPVRVGEPQWVGVGAAAGIGHCVGVEVDGRPFGSITVGDAIRARAHEDIELLRSLGVEPILASTDSDANTRHVGAEVGISRVLGFADPAMMAAEVTQLRGQGRTVGYVGAAHPCGPGETADLAIGTPDTSARVRMDDLDVARLPVLIGTARKALAQRRALIPAAAAGAAVLAVVAGVGLLSIPIAIAATLVWTLVISAVAAS